MHLVGMGGDDVSEFESRYDKALSRCPAKWRELNGDVPLGILMDRAEHGGSGWCHGQAREDEHHGGRFR